MSRVFKFKQFSIDQSNSAMKVGTDGVLLGAWATCSPANNVLDLGTGTGVIALMISQRNPLALVVGMELNPEAVKDAVKNASQEMFINRVSIVEQDFNAIEKESIYDLIVSNPPFYQTDVQSKNLERSLAKHENGLTAEKILSYAKVCLSPIGVVSMILPCELGVQSIDFAEKLGLYLQRICEVKPTPDKKGHRFLLEWGRVDQMTKRETLIIEDGGRHVYSTLYKNLTKEFYLKF